MNVGYVCKAVDTSNPVLANQVRWIEALARQPDVEHVWVLTPKRGPADLPRNVTLSVFGGTPPVPPRRVVLGFSRALATIWRRPDVFFVAQGGPYPALLLPWRSLTGKPVYQWKAMPHISARQRFYTRWCTDLVFTATPSSFPHGGDKLRVVGHGIDTTLFDIRDADRTVDLVALGRVAPVKRLHEVIRTVSAHRDRFGSAPSLDIVGPCDSKNQAYRRELVDQIATLGLTGAVRMLGSVSHDELPALLSHYRAAVNFSQTAFDKSAGEIMASGLPLVTTNPSDAEALPADLREVLSVPRSDAAARTNAIQRVLTWDDATRLDIGKRLREAVVTHHSLDTLFDKIVAAIKEHRGGHDAAS